MGQVVATATVRAEAGPLWAYLTDPNNFPDYVDGYAHGRVTSAQRGLGECYEWFAAAGPLRLRCTEEVVRWQEREQVGYVGQLAGVSFRSAMTLLPHGANTQLHVEVEFTLPAKLGGHIADRWLVTPMVRGSVQRSLARVVARFAG